MKNYIRVAFLFILTVAIVFALSAFYDSYKKYDLTVPVIRGTLKELKPNDLDDYVMENDYLLLYIGVAEDDNCRKLEADLKKVLKDRGLLEEIIYLNLSDEDDKQAYLSSFNNKYAKDISISNYPALLIIKDKVIIDVVERNKEQYMNAGDIEQFLDVNEIKGA